MITEWFMTLGASISMWFITLLPTVENGIFGNVLTATLGLASYIGSMAIWVNWGAMAGQITVVLGLYFTLMMIKLFLRLFSYVPFIGGAG